MVVDDYIVFHWLLLVFYDAYLSMVIFANIRLGVAIDVVDNI